MSQAILIDISSQNFVLFVGVMARTLAACFLFPGFSEPFLPMRYRLMCGFGIGVVIFPFVVSETNVDNSITALSLIGSETVIGLFFGVMVRMAIFALQTAGAIAAQSLSLAQLGNFTTIDPMPAISQVMYVSGLAAFFIFGLHIRLIEIFAQTFLIFEFGHPLVGWQAASSVVLQSGKALALALQLAFPFCLLAVLFNFTLGAINKAMPQLMVALVGAPAAVGIALLLLALTITPILMSWLNFQETAMYLYGTN